MFRPCRLLPCLPVVAAIVLLPGCNTMYRDVYSPQRNYFKPVQEKSNAAQLLDASTTTTTTTTTTPDAGMVAPDPNAPVTPIVPPPDMPGADLPPPPPPAMPMN